MARVTDPLFSRSASGRIGTALLFRRGPAGPRVSRPPDPRRTNQAPPSTAQAAVRARYSAAAAAWRALDPAVRAQWNATAKASTRNLHGWALFLSAFGQPNAPPLPIPANITGGYPPIIQTFNLWDIEPSDTIGFDFLINEAK